MSTFAPPVEQPSNQAAIHGIAERIIFCIFVLVSGLAASFVIVGISLGTSVGTRDFISYWAAGQQLVHRSNPYSTSAVLALEETSGFRAKDGMIVMRNPPSALFLVAPLGFLGARVGSIVWSLLNLGCLASSLRMLWRIYGSPPAKLYLLGYLFPPALFCLWGGQTSIIALLGLVLFLRFQVSRPWVGGFALSLCALKPHLFLPFGIALFAWILTSGAYRVLAGAAAALGTCCAIPLFFDPDVWRQYAQMAAAAGVSNEFRPDLGTYLRFALDRNAFWLQFLPAAAACVWALWYFQRNRIKWEWQRHAPVLMLVSLIATPYSSFFDQVVLLPAIIHGLYSGRSLVTLLALMSLALVQMILGVPMYSNLFAWPAAAWLAWYLWPTQNPRTLDGTSAAA